MEDVKDQTEAPQPVLVVLGLDAENKPHASRFTPADSETAVRAANLMKFHSVNVTDPELQKVAMSLPVGKIFVSGKGLVPFAKREPYDKLATLIGTDAEVRHRLPVGDEIRSDIADKGKVQATETSADSSGKVASTDPWSAIKVGSTVLALSAEAEEGWYEAIVASMSADGGELTLRWRDFQREPVVKRKRLAVGIVPPGR